ncbi:MAG: CsbD family protein [Burkholderiaceae bacterium]
MNKNYIKGTAKEVVGKAQEETGKLVGNDALMQNFRII